MAGDGGPRQQGLVGRTGVLGAWPLPDGAFSYEGVHLDANTPHEVLPSPQGAQHPRSVVSDLFGRTWWVASQISLRRPVEVFHNMQAILIERFGDPSELRPVE